MTPKTLDEAIEYALYIGPLKTIQDRTYWAVREFISEKFGVAVLKHKDCENILMELFADLVNREKVK